MDLKGNNIAILYDGECPLCATFAQKLNNQGDNINIVDARKTSDLKTRIEAQNINVDEGLVVVKENRIYFGSQAMNHLANTLSTDSISLFPFRLFRNYKIANLFYPLLKFFRLLLLKIRGKSLINAK